MCDIGPVINRTSGGLLRCHERRRHRPHVRGRIRRLRPDVIYSFLIAPNLLALALRPWLDGVPVVWGVRSACERMGWKERLPLVLGRALAGRVDGLISNSKAGLLVSRRFGYRTRDAAIIPNGIRVDRWAATGRDLIADFSAELPAAIDLELIFDQSTYTEARLATFSWNLLLGGALVVLILFVTMGARSALIVGLTLPITVSLVLFELAWLGIPLHQMSIIGMIIALGLLIDNAIVIAEEVRRRIVAGASRTTAIAHGVHHLAMPLFGSTLTTALAFVPIAMLPATASTTSCAPRESTWTARGAWASSRRRSRSSPSSTRRC